ncbi:hypothetical protein TWF970_009794 [Orbilia oligospora]|uniref:Uncharacterized protein n=1 Tax=Orbilia oligospora TaxID=2813651 RepID=A0A7C8RGM9_ORBOL|nr:hypothetical protein TWF970_009794 [Orbilia oligospora]
MHYQVNADGAGPLRCKISSTGQSSNWNPGWFYPPVKDQVPGSAKDKPFKAAGTMQLFPFTVTIPKNIKCNGPYEGKRSICMLRCENYALNGPFGGCLPFQLIPPEPQAPPPPPPPVPDNIQNIGNTTEADKVKFTDKEAKEVVAAAGLEEVDEAGDSAENVESEAAVANTNDVNEDKAAADKADDDDDEDRTDGKDTPAEDAAAEKRVVKRVVKRDADDDAVKMALGGEDAPPAMIKIVKQQLKKVPATQKAQLRRKLNAGKTANKAGAKESI